MTQFEQTLRSVLKDRDGARRKHAGGFDRGIPFQMAEGLPVMFPLQGFDSPDDLVAIETSRYIADFLKNLEPGFCENLRLVMSREVWYKLDLLLFDPARQLATLGELQAKFLLLNDRYGSDAGFPREIVEFLRDLSCLFNAVLAYDDEYRRQRNFYVNQSEKPK